MQRQPWIDATKGACILLVLFYHCINQFHFDPETFGIATSMPGAFGFASEFWERSSIVFKPLRMPLFFFISGLLVSDYVKFVPLRACLRRRVYNLLWMFLFWGTVLWIGTYVLNNYTGFQNASYHQFNQAFYATNPGDFLRHLLLGNGAHWYLYALVIYFLTAKWFYPIRWRFVLVLGVLYTFLNFPDTTSANWGTTAILRYMIFFVVGAYWGRHILAYLSQSLSRSVLLLLGLLFLALLSKLLFGVFFRYVGSFAAILAVIIVAPRVGPILNDNLYSWLGHLGRYSLFIYLFHQIYIEALVLVLSLPGVERLLGNEVTLLTLAITFPVTLGLPILYLSIVTGRGLSRVSPAFFRLPKGLLSLPDRDGRVGRHHY